MSWHRFLAKIQRAEDVAAAYDAAYATSHLPHADLITTLDQLLLNYGVEPAAADESERLPTALRLLNLDKLRDKTVLDYGCGTAKAAVVFARAGATVFGFDISPAAVRIGRLRAEANDVGDRVHLAVMAAQRLGLRAESVDYIFGYEVIYY